MNSERLNLGLDVKALHNREFEGHGSVFGNVDHGGDIVMPGAFARTLAEHKSAGTLPQMFWMHQMDQVPGKWLEMSEDDRGLRVKGVLADTQLGNEMRTLMKMDAVRGLSIGFFTRDQDFDKDGNRLIKEVELLETSIVSLAMNPLAEVANVKSRLSNCGEYVPLQKDFERTLRDAGYSRRIAKRITSKVFGEQADVTPVDALREADQNDLARLAKALRDKRGMDIPAESLFS